MLDFMNDNKYVLLIGRVLLVLVFFIGSFGVIVGIMPYDINSIIDFAAREGGIPAYLVWMAMMLKLFGGTAIIIGYQTRFAAIALIFFTLCAAFIFHPITSSVFQKEISMVGGLLILAAVGPGDLSLEGRKKP